MLEKRSRTGLYTLGLVLAILQIGCVAGEFFFFGVIGYVCLVDVVEDVTSICGGVSRGFLTGFWD